MEDDDAVALSAVSGGVETSSTAPAGIMWPVAVSTDMQIDHVGVATDDVAGLVELYGDLLGLEFVHEEQFDGVRVAFLDAGNGYVELLEPADGGTIAQYIDEHGPGIHHLAFRTEDLPAALDRAREMGADLVDEEPREGAWGHDVAFLHPGSTGGVLVEFVEHRSN